MFPDLYSELKTWQAGIAALIGFGGLIAAVLVSARKQRDRDDRIRDQETEAMARALRSEIVDITAFLNIKNNNIRELISENEGSENITFRTTNFRDLVIPPIPQVYERCMEKVGFLPPETSKNVMDYYGYLKVATRVVSEKFAVHPDEMARAQLSEIADWFEGLKNKSLIAGRSLNEFLKDSGGSAA